jgi:uncharacterized YigZ family protein
MGADPGDIFRTIEAESTGTHKDRGSKFLAFGRPVSSVDEVKDCLRLVKKDYHDARHHCFAYRIGTENQQYRYNDDGEPSGTAGKPIYGQILSYDVTNILIVVVRYFGGTLLGTSGLIHAYRMAAKNCLENANIIELTAQKLLTLHFGYEQMNKVMHMLKEEGAAIVNRKFEADCRIQIRIPRSALQRLTDKITLLNHVEILDN